MRGVDEDAVRAHARRDRIVIDPAHDFGKNTWQSLELTRRTADLVATGWPVLVAVSNKDFVGETLDLPVQERAEGTLAALAVCAWEGARLFRVHDVPAARDALAAVAALHTSEEVAALRSAGDGAGAAGGSAGAAGGTAGAGTKGSGRPRR